jgi:hypothetical protein
MLFINYLYSSIALLGHIASLRIMEYYPDLVFLHISDAMAFAIKQKKFKKVLFKVWTKIIVSMNCF